MALDEGQDPFAREADARMYVPRAATEDALEALTSALLGGEPTATLAGPAGLGKTLLLRLLPKRLGPLWRCVHLASTGVDPADLWHVMATSLGLQVACEEAIRSAAAGAEGRGGGLALLVDDAHALPDDTRLRVEEFCDRTPGMHAVFAETRSADLFAPGAIGLLAPLSLDEARMYLRMRLDRAPLGEVERQRIEAADPAELHARSGGVPARLHDEVQAVLRGTTLPQRRLPRVSSLGRVLRGRKAQGSPAVPPSVVGPVGAGAKPVAAPREVEAPSRGADVAADRVAPASAHAQVREAAPAPTSADDAPRLQPSPERLPDAPSRAAAGVRSEQARAPSLVSAVSASPADRAAIEKIAAQLDESYARPESRSPRAAIERAKADLPMDLPLEFATASDEAAASPEASRGAASDRVASSPRAGSEPPASRLDTPLHTAAPSAEESSSDAELQTDEVATHEAEHPRGWGVAFGPSPLAGLAAGIALLVLSLALMSRLPDESDAVPGEVLGPEPAALGPAAPVAEVEPGSDRVDEFALASQGGAEFAEFGVASGPEAEPAFGGESELAEGFDTGVTGDPGEGAALWETGELEEGIRRTTLSVEDASDPSTSGAFADVVMAEVEPLEAAPSPEPEVIDPPSVAAGPPPVVVGRGRLSVNAMPWATVFIDGDPYGETPLGEIELPFGDHEVRAEFPDGARVTRDVTIGEDEVFLVLRPDA